MVKKSYVFGGIAILVICCIYLMIVPVYFAVEPPIYYSPDYEESYTTGDFDQLQIWRIYRLTSADSPSYIPTKGFELNGWKYHMLRKDMEESDGQTIYTVIFNGTKIQ